MEPIAATLVKAVHRVLAAQDALEEFHDPECFPKPPDAFTPGYPEANLEWSAAEASLRELMASEELQRDFKASTSGPALHPLRPRCQPLSF